MVIVNGLSTSAENIEMRYAMVMLTDPTAIGYLVLILLCIYGAGLFSWGLWAARSQRWHVSAMYLYILLVFVFLGYAKCLALVSRYYTLTDPHVSYVFRSSIWWVTRFWPLSTVLFAIVGHMSCRAFSNQLARDNKED
jgi:small-conductance mechanosensitive channel